MASLLNLVRVTTSTTGTGSTIAIGSAVSGYLTPALAGAVNGTVYDYGIKDGSDSETGTITYSTSGPQFTGRTVTKSTNSNAAIALSGSAEIYLTVRAETLNDASLFTTGTVNTGRLGSGTANSGTFLRGDSTWAAVTVPTQATQSDMEAASSTTTFVSPANFKWSPYAAKAWVKWGTTTTIDASAGVSSITDNNIGDWTINWSTAFSSANYVASYVAEFTPVGGGNAAFQYQFITSGGQAAGSLRVNNYQLDFTGFSLNNNVRFDPAKNHVIAFGDQ